MYTGRLSCVAFTFIPQGCKLFGLPSLDQDRLSFADFHFFAQCSDGGGQWFRTPCITLHRCIDARPRKDEDGYSQSFEDFVVSNEIEIYDYTDLEQCQTARAALGFDVDHPNDDEVCGQFNNTMCELHNWIFVSFLLQLIVSLSPGDPFFRDLEFLASLAGVGADGEIKFEQVTYIPIE